MWIGFILVIFALCCGYFILEFEDELGCLIMIVALVVCGLLGFWGLVLIADATEAQNAALVNHALQCIQDEIGAGSTESIDFTPVYPETSGPKVVRGDWSSTFPKASGTVSSNGENCTVIVQSCPSCPDRSK